MNNTKASLVRRMYSGHLWPDEQVAGFRGAYDLFPTRCVPCGPNHGQLPYEPADLQAFTFAHDGAHYDLYDYVSANRVAGMLVCQSGRIVFEQYALGLDPQTRWLSMSMAKSISSALVGVAIQDGLIGSIEDPVSDYLPQLANGAYHNVSIRQLLSMTTGVAWDEEYTDPGSDRRAMLELQIEQCPGTITDYMARRPQLSPPGTLWNYNTGETHLLGALLRAATGRWLADYLAEKLWIPLGMERSAYWWLESDDDLEAAGTGLFATLRDFTRFGLFMLGNGVHQGVPLLPPGWVTASGNPTALIDGAEAAPYGYMWWPINDSQGTHIGFSARGIFGQRLLIFPAAEVVVTVLSARAKPKFSERFDDNAVIAQLVKLLQS